MMALRFLQRRLRRLSLFWRVSLTNMLVVAAGGAILVVSPATLSSPASIDEVGVLGAGLAVTLVVNTLLIGRWFAPLTHLTRAMRDADLLEAGSPMPEYGADANVMQLTRGFNEMLTRLRAERIESGRRAVGAQEAERLRVARELHDEVGQSLTALLIELDRVAQGLGPHGAALGTARESARATLEYVRLIAQQLRPEALDDLGLTPALAALSDRLGRLVDARIEHELPGELPALSPEAELAIYRVAQEGLTNAIRHAECSRVDLRLSCRDGAVVLDLSDDGRGLADARPGMGLRGMAERALLVGAHLVISSGSGPGTRLRLEVPAGAPA